MKSIPVKLGSRTYSIVVGQGVLSQVRAAIQRYSISDNYFIITNSKIEKWYGAKVRQQLGHRYKDRWIIIPDGEKYKNIQTVEKIYKQIIKRGCDRHTLIVALGGGVIGDVAGFVAATVLRGIPFIQVPTTLLAQVDSSVGGKTGVDLPEGKNLVGAFYQPKKVLIDTSVLKTLPKREFLCGMAEVVKYGLLGDDRLFGYIEKNIGNILALRHNVLEQLISRSCAIKADIVSRDEKETSGLRATLNLGHTLAHAIETLSGYNVIKHGEAVSMGLVYASTLSCARGYCSQEVLDRIMKVLGQLGLPVQWPKYSRAQYQRVMSRDKKAVGNKVTYVALEKIGKTKLVSMTPKEITQYI